MLGAELLAADHSGSESSSAAVRRKRSGPSQPTQPRMTHGSGSPGWIRVPLPSQELAVRVHRRDRGRGSSFVPTYPPSPNIAMPGELGARRAGCHPLQHPPSSGCAGFGVELGFISTWAGNAGAPSPPYPQTPHPVRG